MRSSRTASRAKDTPHNPFKDDTQDTKQWYSDPNRRARQHFGPFKELFVHLKDIRRWGARDRLEETGVLEYWEENLALSSDAILSEAELWPHQDSVRRSTAYQQLQRLVERAGGRCLLESAIPEIRYHGVLIELPAAVVRSTIDLVMAQQATALLRCEQVMFFRAAAQARFRPPSETMPALALWDRLQDAPLPAGDPVAALLDGLPLMQHIALANRIVLDDPEGSSQQYQAVQQRHGTAMASLIIHGDPGKTEPPLSGPLYVRPLYQPFLDLNADLAYEGTPRACLLVDLFHRAIKRIKVGEGDLPAVAPSVKVINLSFGDSYRPFDRNLSPLARLLDWLSHKYNVLFLVSAGNQEREIVIEIEQEKWKALSHAERAQYTLRALGKDQALRRPFSPAEAINVITVASMHADERGLFEETALRMDLLGGAALAESVQHRCSWLQTCDQAGSSFAGWSPDPSNKAERKRFDVFSIHGFFADRDTGSRSRATAHGTRSPRIGLRNEQRDGIGDAFHALHL